MYKVATKEEIDELVHVAINEYKEKILERLSEYQPSQKIPRNKVEEILNEVYDSEIEAYFFTVESKTGKVDML